MRELHVVAVSEDGRHVVLAATKGTTKGSYRVRLDARLVAAVRGDLRSGSEPAVDLSPKEIQARLRAGESVESIARSAGVAVTRVERFAGPVAGEMARMIEGARDAFVVRGRIGRSSVPMGKAVDAALAAHAKPDSVSWSTRRDEDGRWRVTVSWFARGKTRDAAWWYDPHDKSLTAVDTAAAALGHQDANPAPKRRTPPRAAAPAEKAPAKKVPAKKAAAKKAAKPAPTKARTARAAPSGKAMPGVLVKAPAKPVAPKQVVRKKPAPAARKAAARPRLQVVPHPDTPVPAKAVDNRDGVRTRASVPAWADVLLGTTPGAER